MLGRQVQDHDVGDAAISRNLFEELLDRLDATGGGADADNKKVLGAHDVIVVSLTG